MNGVIANGSSRYSRVHILKNNLPLCGQRPMSVTMEKLEVNEQGYVLKWKRHVKSTEPVIQFDLGDCNCRRCMKLQEKMNGQRV